MKLLEMLVLHANPINKKEEKSLFEDDKIKASQSCMMGKNFRDYYKDWLTVTLTLECPTCHKIKKFKMENEQVEHFETLKSFNFIWRWAIDKNLHSEEIKEWLKNKTFRCACGTLSSLDDNSIRKLLSKIEKETKSLPINGVEWAKQVLNNFLSTTKWVSSRMISTLRII